MKDTSIPELKLRLENFDFKVFQTKKITKTNFRVNMFK